MGKGRYHNFSTKCFTTLEGLVLICVSKGKSRAICGIIVNLKIYWNLKTALIDLRTWRGRKRNELASWDLLGSEGKARCICRLKNVECRRKCWRVPSAKKRERERGKPYGSWWAVTDGHTITLRKEYRYLSFLRYLRYLVRPLSHFYAISSYHVILSVSQALKCFRRVAISRKIGTAIFTGNYVVQVSLKDANKVLCWRGLKRQVNFKLCRKYISIFMN